MLLPAASPHPPHPRFALSTRTLLLRTLLLLHTLLLLRTLLTRGSLSSLPAPSRCAHPPRTSTSARAPPSLPQFRPVVLQRAAMDEVQARIAKGRCTKGASLAPFQEQALALRASCAGVVDLLAQPVPVPYYWTLNLMLTVNLLLVAYAMIGAGTLMSIPTYFIIALVTLGMKETAVALSDPFGLDAVDFETDAFMGGIMLNTKAMIAPNADWVPTTCPVPSLSDEAVDLNKEQA